MRRRTINIIKDVEVDVDVDASDILEQLDDLELEAFGLARISGGFKSLAQAIWDFHESEHGGLLNGCTHKPCIDFDYDAVELIRSA